MNKKITAIINIYVPNIRALKYYPSYFLNVSSMRARIGSVLLTVLLQC